MLIDAYDADEQNELCFFIFKTYHVYEKTDQY